MLRLAAQQLDLPLSALLRDCALFVHGSTVATNTILEKKGAKVGMLTTEGFRDSLEIRRGIRENQWDHRAPFPPVLAPRYLRLPVRGRIGADGKELAPLVAEDVDAAAKVFAAEGVESVAVCLFNSFLDGAHERKAGSATGARMPGREDGSACRAASADHGRVRARLDRRGRRLHRAQGDVSYVTRLADALVRRGLKAPLLVVQNNGGALTVAQSADRPVALLLSGPAAGSVRFESLGRAGLRRPTSSRWRSAAPVATSW